MDKKKNTQVPLLAKIEKTISDLSKSEATVAQYIVDNPKEVVNMPIAELAAICEVSEPTVVRTCRSVGFLGYQALKIALIQGISAPISYEGEEISNDDDVATIAHKISSSAVDAIRLTQENLNIEDVEKAADLFSNAGRVLIFATGGSTSVALEAEHKFMRIGLDAKAFTDANTQTIAATFARDRDVIFAISHSGASKLVIDNSRLAKTNGATVISLTSRWKSPLSKTSDIPLFTVANEPYKDTVAVSSRYAELAIVDLLYLYMSLSHGDAKSQMVK